jgi:hypothetical protein
MALERPRYTDEAAKRILQQAMELQMRDQESSFSREQLVEMAADLGISPDTLQAAEQQWLKEQEGREEREAEQAEMQAFLRERRQMYKMHLALFVIINLFLFLMNIFTGGGIWFIYPLLGWGMGITAHTLMIRQTEGTMFDGEFEQWRNNRKMFRKPPPTRRLPS